MAEQLTTGTDLAENVKKVIKSYTPYGEQLNEKLFGFGYNGEEYDSATGMVYLRARWYEPAMVSSGRLSDAAFVTLFGAGFGIYINDDQNP